MFLRGFTDVTIDKFVRRGVHSLADFTALQNQSRNAPATFQQYFLLETGEVSKVQSLLSSADIKSGKKEATKANLAGNKVDFPTLCY